MANAYCINQVLGTPGAVISAVVEMLVSAGWTYRASGDGLSGYNATGKVFTSTNGASGATVALGWGNPGAWARIRDPGGTREFVVQHDGVTTGLSMRLKYSPSAKFTGGTPSATVTPSATDEKLVRGGGTDGAPTYGTWVSNLSVAAGPVIFMGAAMGSAPYGFWFCGQQQGGTNQHISTGTRTANLLFDPVLSVVEDPDPYVLMSSAQNGFVATTATQSALDTNYTLNTAGSTNAYLAVMSADGTQWLNVHPAAFTVGGYNATSHGASIIGSVNAGSSILNPSSFSGKTEMLPVPYLRTQLISGTTTMTQIAGMKGWSTLTRWSTGYRSPFELDNSKNWICVGSFWVPWDGVSQPIGY